MNRVERCPSCSYQGINNQIACDLAICSSCAVAFRSPRPSFRDIISAYDQGETFDQWQNELQQRTPLWQKRANLIHRYCRGGRLLDIGTGDGFFLRFISDQFNCVATEVSRHAVKYAKNRGGHIIQGSHEAITPKPTFEVITAWHVLEHVHDPYTFMTTARSIVQENGLMVIAVPNERFKIAKYRLFRRSNKSSFEPLYQGSEIHLSFFTSSTLKRLIDDTGWVSIDFGIDDVCLTPNWRYKLKLATNQLLNRWFGTHFMPAMYMVCKPKQEAL